jgi:hypothetical protein
MGFARLFRLTDMSEHVVPGTRKLAVSHAAMPWLVAAGVYGLLMILGPRLLADPDTYSHIALGRWIFEHQGVPTVDPFSQTMRGEHWVAFEWLSQVIYAGALSLGGWTGVVAVAAAGAAATFGLLTRFLLREWQPVPVLIAVLAAFVLTSPHILARPHILAMPIMVAWVASLIRAIDERRTPSWHLLPLMTLWANLHGSFTFGLAMVGATACDALWNAPASQRFQVARHWVLFGLLALAAACINPYGPEMILVTFRTIALGQALQIITEWRPQDFSHLGAFEIIMLAGFGYALLRGVKLPVLRLVMLFGVLHLALSQSRQADLLGLLAPLFLARGRRGAADRCDGCALCKLGCRRRRSCAADRHRICRFAPRHDAARRYHPGKRDQIDRSCQERSDPQRLRLRRLYGFYRHCALHRRADRVVRRGFHRPLRSGAQA